MKKIEQRMEFVKFRVTVEELYQIDTKALDLGLTRSEYIRQACLSKKITAINFNGLDKLAGEIGKIGVNINQIARKVNQGVYLSKDSAEYLKSCIIIINAALEKIYSETMQKMNKE